MLLWLMLSIAATEIKERRLPNVPYPENEGWPVPYHYTIGGPLVVDVDGNGELDVVACRGDAWSNVDVMAWSSEGFPLEGWPKYLRHRSNWPFPGADFDNDGRIEVVIVPYRSQDPTQIVAYRHDDTIPSGWPIDIKWMSVGGPSFSDLNGDGKLEAAAAITMQLELATELHLYDWRGREMPGWPKPIDQQISNAPVMTDLDLDGDLEVLAGAALLYFGPGWIYAYHHDGTPYGEDEILVEVSGGIIMDPMSVGDLTGDLHPEIIATDRNTAIHVIDWRGDPVPGWPPDYGFGPIEGMPVIVHAPGGVRSNTMALLAHQYHGGALLYDGEGQLIPGWPWARGCTCRS